MHNFMKKKIEKINDENPIILNDQFGASLGFSAKEWFSLRIGMIDINNLFILCKVS